MRVHINLDEQLLTEIDRRVGRRKRSGFIAATLRRAVEDERRWDDIIASLGKLGARDHDWDEDPAAWVRAQRRGDRRRVG